MGCLYTLLCSLFRHIVLKNDLCSSDCLKLRIYFIVIYTKKKNDENFMDCFYIHYGVPYLGPYYC